jgi:hypothetical protein
VIKSRWIGEARLGRNETRTEILCGNLNERTHLKDGAIDGRIILKLMIKKYDRRC